MKKILSLAILIFSLALAHSAYSQPYNGRSELYKQGYKEGLNAIIAFKNNEKLMNPLAGTSWGVTYYKVDFDYPGGIRKIDNTSAEIHDFDTKQWLYQSGFDEINFNAAVMNMPSVQSNINYYETKRLESGDYADYWEGYGTGYGLGIQIAYEDLQ